MSVLLMGWLSDRLGRHGRAGLLAAGIALSIPCLVALAGLDAASRPTAAVILVALTAFTIIGPYSFLAGAISLDFGGKHASAIAAGIIDGVGYLGGVLAGAGIARISLAYGWSGAFLTLAGVDCAACLASLANLGLRRRASSAPNGSERVTI